MARTYLEVMGQIGKLQAEAESLRRKEVAGVIKRIREAIDHYGLTSQDLGFKVPRLARAAGVRKATAGARYGDGQGNVWGGRGPRPAWLREALAQGRTLEEFVLGGSASDAAGDAAPAKKRAKAQRGSKRRTAASRDGKSPRRASTRGREVQPSEAGAATDQPPAAGPDA